MSRTILFLALAATMLTSPASAVLIYLEDDRNVSAAFQDCFEPFPGGIECDPAVMDALTPATPFSPFDENLFNLASQDSVTTLTDIRATGSSTTFSDVGFASGSSAFDIVFQLFTPLSILIEGEVFASSATFSLGTGLASVTLQRDNGSGFDVVYRSAVESSDLFGDSELVSFQGTLAPGIYRLGAFASGNGGSESGYDFELTSATVPEASSAALVGLCLVGLALASRRSRDGAA